MDNISILCNKEWSEFVNGTTIIHKCMQDEGHNGPHICILCGEQVESAS